MKAFSLSDFHIVMPGPDTAIIAYKSKMEGTSGGKDVSGVYNCGTVWNLKNGEWRAVFHSDMRAEQRDAANSDRINKISKMLSDNPNALELNLF